MVTRSLLPACVVLAERNWLGCLEQDSSSHVVFRSLVSMAALRPDLSDAPQNMTASATN